ncbi:uncharacterized mitochondrial protein AtMg00810-like [Solanum tuberosum]|uniref:uncharacterized mitochondrial protein AtMg00810-like n=1 Tax=Solanum tuberosum TaxID=4113 RepID=UPI00073A02AA|nr:PREDICTED: uncharacterized mitochondrial protein AtMg00810-like [Solanum tuberosum]
MSKCDHSVFYRQSTFGSILLVVHVDEIVITGSDYAGISSLKYFLHNKFQMKDLAPLRYFLGVEVNRRERGILKYILDLFADTGKLGAKPYSTLMVPNVHLMTDDDDPEKYRRLVGKLNYLIVTRPNISFAVSVVSQFMFVPMIKHWEALEQIMCYLKGSPGLGILYRNIIHTRVECFTNVGSKIDRRSTTCYCVFVGGNLVSWRSNKQSVVSRSSA